jgi:hypothetical protein
MKTLYILVSDGGDGSYYPQFTFSKVWIDAQQERYDNHGYNEGIGQDGDGFHYTELSVPDECTLKSLGIRRDCAK